MPREVFTGVDRGDAADGDDDEIVCHCLQVGRRRLHAAIAAGARTVEDLHRATGASGGCGGCRGDLEEMLAAENEGPGPIR